MDNTNKNDNLPSDDLGHSQAIKAAIHMTVGQISEETGTQYGLTFDKPFVATLAELINRQIEVYANDLEAFAKHARRTCIGCEDVKLLVRRNPKLKEAVTGFIDEVEASTSSVTKRGRKRKASKIEKSEEVEAEAKAEPEPEPEVEVIDIT